MFKISGRNSDPQSSLMKFLDHNKDSFKRLKGLQKGLGLLFPIFTSYLRLLHYCLVHAEKSSPKETKKFYERYHSTIFFTFYACFTTIEASLQSSRGTKSSKTRQEACLKDLMEMVLPALEVLVNLLADFHTHKYHIHCRRSLSCYQR